METPEKVTRTTVILPEELLNLAKITAVREDTTFGQLLKQGLEQRLGLAVPPTPAKPPLELLGKYRLGQKNIYRRRENLYEKRLNRKMGL